MRNLLPPSGPRNAGVVNRRLHDLERKLRPNPAPAVASGGMRFATAVLAASDTDLRGRDVDTIALDGSAHLSIADAVDSLPQDGGTVVLLDGHYRCSASDLSELITISGKDNVRICGMGPGTILDFSESAWLLDLNPPFSDFILGTLFYIDCGGNLSDPYTPQVEISDLRIIGGSDADASPTVSHTAIEVLSGKVHVRNVAIESASVVLEVDAASSELERLYFTGQVGQCIDVYAPSCKVKRCRFGDSQGAAQLGGSPSLLTTFWVLAQLEDTAVGSEISECVVDGAESSNGAFQMAGDHQTVRDCLIGVKDGEPVVMPYEVIEASGNHCSILDNVITNCKSTITSGTTGALYAGGEHDIVRGNHVEWEVPTTIFAGGCQLNDSGYWTIVEGNVFVAVDDPRCIQAIGTRSRYLNNTCIGGDIDVYGDDCVLAFNDLNGNAINDSGSGTLLNFDGSANDWNIY